MSSNVPAGWQPGKTLTPAEKSRLAELEAAVQRGLSTFIVVGSALAEISRDRLYRSTHDTFDAYVQDKWGFSTRRAYQMIGAAEVAASLPPGTPKPTTERQARELAKVEPEKRVEVMQKAVERAGSEGRQRPVQRDVKDAVLSTMVDKSTEVDASDEAGWAEWQAYFAWLAERTPPSTDAPHPTPEQRKHAMLHYAATRTVMFKPPKERS